MAGIGVDFDFGGEIGDAMGSEFLVSDGIGERVVRVLGEVLEKFAGQSLISPVSLFSSRTVTRSAAA